MNNQVLLVEQMQELIDMGIDTSSASCIWWNFADLGFALMFLNDGRESLTIEKMKENHGAENIVPAFTFQDILEMLPDIGKEYANHPHVFKASDGIHWYCSYGTMTCEIKGKTPLEAAFNMLKWVKQNNYI